MDQQEIIGGSQYLVSMAKDSAPHSQHPDFGHLTLLVFEAVMEVVCVSLPGYIVARNGMFDVTAQKFVANLNMTLFTPCLSTPVDAYASHREANRSTVFTKLASQLNGDRLIELIIIPCILLAQTVISYVAAKICTRIFKMRKKPQANFITAMAVCYKPFA